MSRDAGSNPAASTDAGVTTRLKPKKARQFILTSLSLLPHPSRVCVARSIATDSHRGTHLPSIVRRKTLNLAKSIKVTALSQISAALILAEKSDFLLGKLQKFSSRSKQAGTPKLSVRVYPPFSAAFDMLNFLFPFVGHLKVAGLIRRTLVVTCL